MSRKDPNEILSPDVIRESVQKYARKDEPTEYPAGKWGAMIGWLNKYLLTDELRHLVLGWLMARPGEKFKPISSNALTPQQKNGVARWIGTTKIENEWYDSPTFGRECLTVLNAARYDYAQICGQMVMDLPFEVDGEPAGVVTKVLEDDGPWCEWCGDVLAPPGVPCKRCEELGAVAQEPRKVTGVAI